MNRMELTKRNHYARVSVLMAVASLAFLYYMGSSMTYSAKRYQQQVSKCLVMQK